MRGHSRVCVLSHFSRIQLFATPWMAARQAPLSMGILQARILEWVAVSASSGPSQPTDQTCVSCISCPGKQILYHSGKAESLPDSLPRHHLGNPKRH